MKKENPQTWSDVLKIMQAADHLISPTVDQDGRGVSATFHANETGAWHVRLFEGFAGCKVMVNGETRSSLDQKGNGKIDATLGQMINFSIREPN